MLFVFLLHSAYGDVLVNEVLYDPATGSDSENEWVELCNNGVDDIDVSGWQLETAGTSWSESWTFPPGSTVPAGSHLLFGPGAGGDEFSPNLQNGGSATDGVRLVDNTGKIVDTLLYDENNTNALVDDQGSTAGPFASDPSAGYSLGRIPDCSDSNNNGLDFSESETPTPGSENVASSAGGEPGSCESVAVTGILINEFLPDPSGADSDREWIELYNSAEEAIDISGWTLEAGSSSFSEITEFPSGTFMSPGSYLLIGDELVQESILQQPDFVAPMSLGNAGSNADGLRLVDCYGYTIDTVIYGEELNEDDGWLDDFGGTPTSLAPKPRSGQSIGRVPNGSDSDLSGDDFQVLDFVSPWDANDGERSCEGQDSVKINEFLPNPDSEETSADDLLEWVELYNDSSSDIPLLGWSLQWGTSSYGSEYTISTEISIPANGFLLIGGEGVSEADIVVPAESDLSLGSASSNTDALRLLHCGPGVSDTVIYGSDNEDEWEDDLGFVADSFAPKPTAGLSIARRFDGGDSDESGVDFVVGFVNTPGAANPEVNCEAGSHSVKINEIFPNPVGSDSGNEWIELFNPSGEEVVLDGWTIETAAGSWTSKHVFPPGFSIAPGAFFLLADSNVPESAADAYASSSLSLGNASTGYDGVRLLDCPGNVEDTLLYGKADAWPSEEEEQLLDDAGGESAGVLPGSGFSLGRYPDGEDSDDNAEDFQSEMSPTPGLPNLQGGEEPGGGGSGGLPGEQGCGKNSQPSSQPSKCAVADPATGLWGFCLAFFLCLRRRR
jgi:hypothetical protein